MTRESKEFTRRIKKMQKHVTALRPLAAGGSEENSLSHIASHLDDLAAGRTKGIPHGAGAGAPSGRGGLNG